MTDLDLDDVLNDHTVYTTATDLRADNVEDALDALLDAVPALVAALREARAEVALGRERIAAEVRAWCHEERHGQAIEGDHWITVLCGDCEELAARIARGQS